MGKLFQSLVNDGLIVQWADTLDWLFDDNRFSKEKGWNRGYVSLFTKKMLRFNGFSEKNGSFVVRKADEVVFPNHNESVSPGTPHVVMIKGDSVARDFVRHIRNGIAHGKTQIHRNSGKLYIEILDFDTGGKKQTAFLFMPMSYITDARRVYSEIEKSIAHTSLKDRNARKRKGSRELEVT